MSRAYGAWVDIYLMRLELIPSTGGVCKADVPEDVARLHEHSLLKACPGSNGVIAVAPERGRLLGVSRQLNCGGG